MRPAIALADELPDLVLELSRNGIILGHAGGLAVRALRLQPDAMGKPLVAVYPLPVAIVVKQLARRAIACRGCSESNFVHLGIRYEARVSARSANRALCVIRALSDSDGSASAGEPAQRGYRLNFWHRVSELIATATLRGRPLALALIHLEGIAEITKLMDATVAEGVVEGALRPLIEKPSEDGSVTRCVGQLADDMVAVLVSSDLRDTIETQVLQVCARLSHPVSLGDAIYQLTTRAGAAILGQDATSEPALVEHARAAMIEAQRADLSEVSFFSDTTRVRSLTRIDVALELRDAIAQGDITLRYRGRHELASGRLTAVVGYLRWEHPMRGVIHPSQFLPAAAATGLATHLSRSILDQMSRDYTTHRSLLREGVRISYGARGAS